MAYTESSCHFLAEFSEIENPLFPALESNNNFLRRTRQKMMQFGLPVMSFEDEVYNFCATSSTKKNCKNNECLQMGFKTPQPSAIFQTNRYTSSAPAPLVEPNKQIAIPFGVAIVEKKQHL